VFDHVGFFSFGVAWDGRYYQQRNPWTSPLRPRRTRSLMRRALSSRSETATSSHWWPGLFPEVKAERGIVKCNPLTKLPLSNVTIQRPIYSSRQINALIRSARCRSIRRTRQAQPYTMAEPTTSARNLVGRYFKLTLPSSRQTRCKPLHPGQQQAGRSIPVRCTRKSVRTIQGRAPGAA